MVRLGWRFACLAKKYLHPDLFIKEMPPAVPPGHELLGGKRPRLGVRITRCGNKTKRIWKLNVSVKTYYSDVLEENVTMKMTNYCMRLIDRAGGFDNYVYHTPPEELDSTFGEELKLRMAVELCKRRDKPIPPLVIYYHKPPTDEIWKERVKEWKEERIATLFAKPLTKQHQCVGVNKYRFMCS